MDTIKLQVIIPASIDRTIEKLAEDTQINKSNMVVLLLRAGIMSIIEARKEANNKKSYRVLRVPIDVQDNNSE